jgi:DNA polymerase-3 subunit gamma/tau
LATTEKHKILPTILSRCQIFDFKRITTNDTVEHLQEICDKEDIKAEKAALQVIAQKSEGCMRDALSILDKIVSFTNGELNYTNTLEHLNILDAEVYFKLLDCMQQQDLSGAMLLYDDINRKGFEGDLVLTGFAEFIRNLLVCKDEKAASLLEVVESFKDKYVSTAKEVSSSLLISALNILNDAEINYKAARNKRLHVELAIIKLCYLQQAIELSAESSAVTKKKLIDAAKPVAFRSITPFTPASLITKEEENTGARLIIETGPKPKQQLNEEKATYQKPGITQDEIKERPKAPTRITALNKIREQFQNNDNQQQKTDLALQQDELQKAWAAYIVSLKEIKSPAAQSFELAVLRIRDANTFEAVISNNIEKQFIEQERNKLFIFLRDSLHNGLLQFSVVVEERTENRPVIEIPLSSSEQYNKMVQMYPLVKELKDRLNLTLDY